MSNLGSVPSLAGMRTNAYHQIEQIENGYRIVWGVRPVDPAVLFRAETLIGTLIEATSNLEAVSSDLDEAERLARTEQVSATQRLINEVDAYQTIALSAVVAVATPVQGNSDPLVWRAVSWVSTHEEENDSPGEPIGLHIGWISKAALERIVTRAGLKVIEVAEKLRFPGSEE